MKSKGSATVFTVQPPENTDVCAKFNGKSFSLCTKTAVCHVNLHGNTIVTGIHALETQMLGQKFTATHQLMSQ